MTAAWSGFVGRDEDPAVCVDVTPRVTALLRLMYVVLMASGVLLGVLAVSDDVEPGVIVVGVGGSVASFGLILVFARWAARDAEQRDYEGWRAEGFVLVLYLLGPLWWLLRRRRLPART
jgi:hypothetical protein